MKLQKIADNNSSFKLNYLKEDTELCREVQQKLINLKLLNGSVDGKAGKFTLSALIRFCEALGNGNVYIINRNIASALLHVQSIQAFFADVPKTIPIAGLELIQQFESYSYYAYPDSMSNSIPYSCGWGSTKGITGGSFSLNDTLNPYSADYLLIQQLEKEYLHMLEQTVPYWDELNQNQKGALLSLSYNLGSNIMIKGNFDSIRQMLRDRTYHNAMSVFTKYINPGTVVEAGLRRRRIAEAELFMKE